MMPKKYLSRDELGKLLGVSGTKLFQKWERGGMPFMERRKKNGGVASHIYEKESALQWLRGHGSAALASRAKQELDKMHGVERGAASADGEPQARAEVDTTGVSIGDEGPEGAYLRAMKSEKIWHDAEMAAVENGDWPLAALCGKKKLEYAASMTRLAMEILDLQTREGKLVDADELESEHLKSITTVKNNILGVPSALIPSLIPFLRDPNDAAAVEQAIEGKLKDAFRSTAENGRGKG